MPYGTNAFDAWDYGSKNPIGEGSGKTDPITPQTKATNQSSGGGNYDWIGDIIKGISDYKNRPKDGKWQEVPLPQEIRNIFNLGTGYAVKSPTRDLIAPWAMGIAQASGIPKFQLSNLVEGPGIPKGPNGENWTYKSGGTGQFDFDKLQDAFMNYLGGKNSGGAKPPTNMGNAAGPKGLNGGGGFNLNGAVRGPRNKDQGEWHEFNRITGGSTAYDDVTNGGGLGGRDAFGMRVESWRQTFGNDPTTQRAYQAYHDWLSGLSVPERKAELEKQANLEKMLFNGAKQLGTSVANFATNGLFGVAKDALTGLFGEGAQVTKATEPTRDGVRWYQIVGGVFGAAGGYVAMGPDGAVKGAKLGTRIGNWLGDKFGGGGNNGG